MDPLQKKGYISAGILLVSLFIEMTAISCRPERKASPHRPMHRRSVYTDSGDFAPGWTRNLDIDGVRTDIFVPQRKAKYRCLLVLPGWNYAKERWIRDSRLALFARDRSYILILPEMGKTLYESRYYPQTSMKWHNIPGGRFIREWFLPFMQKKGLLLPGGENAILGLSTGGRGAVLVSLENPGVFKAAASLSGDFNQWTMPTDRLMRAVYGPSSEYMGRWQGRDNPYFRAAEWKIPLFLGHGGLDPVVPVSQSRDFYRRLRKYGKKNIVYKEDKAGGHDFAYWDRALDDVFAFFEMSFAKAKNQHRSF